MASNDEVLKRLLELGARHTDADARREQRELVKNLASNLDVQLDVQEVEEPVSEPVSEHAHETEQETSEPAHHDEPVHHDEPARVPTPEPEPVREPVKAPVKEAPKPVLAARAAFEQPQENKAKKVVAPTQRKSMPPPKRDTAPAPAGGNECDLSDPKITEAYEDVRDDNTDSDWLLLGYASSKKELKLYGSGNGGLKEFVSALPDAEVVYGYIRMKYGDSGRAKFVFITYVPDTLSGLAKAKANMHKPSVDRFLKYFHVQVSATSPAELSETTIQAKLQSAAGANYGTGGAAPAGSEDFGSIKSNSKSFFLQTEKRGSVQIKYNKDPLSRETPVSLIGRAGITEKYIST